MKKTGILCATEKEIRPFLDEMKNIQKANTAMLSFQEGTIDSVPVIAVYSGVGKINAAIAAQILISQYEAEYIFISGIAGGMGKDVAIFDTVVCTEFVCHDTNNEIYTEYHPWLNEPKFYADKELVLCARAVAENVPQRVHFGLSTTGESFINLENSDDLCIEMENIAAAHVCYVNHIPFIAIRSISDNNQENGQEVIDKNFDRASYQSFLIVKEMIKKLNKMI